eukprot:883544-Amphidinium_carterae.4
MKQLVARRPEFEGLELGIDGRAIKAMRTLAGTTTPLEQFLILSYPLPGCWQSVYRAELHAIMVACERMQGHGIVVTDCKGAAVVANKLKAGLRAPRGRQSRLEARIRDSIGNIEVHWMRSQLFPRQRETPA